VCRTGGDGNDDSANHDGRVNGQYNRLLVLTGRRLAKGWRVLTYHQWAFSYPSNVWLVGFFAVFATIWQRQSRPPTLLCFRFRAQVSPGDFGDTDEEANQQTSTGFGISRASAGVSVFSRQFLVMKWRTYAGQIKWFFGIRLWMWHLLTEARQFALLSATTSTPNAR